MMLLSFICFKSHMNTHGQINNHHGTCTGTQPTKKRKLHSCAVFYCGGGLLPFCISRLQPNSNTQPTSKWPPSSFQKSQTQQLQYWSWEQFTTWKVVIYCSFLLLKVDLNFYVNFLIFWHVVYYVGGAAIYQSTSKQSNSLREWITIGPKYNGGNLNKWR